MTKLLNWVSRLPKGRVWLMKVISCGNVASRM
jgi:SusD family.